MAEVSSVFVGGQTAPGGAVHSATRIGTRWSCSCGSGHLCLSEEAAERAAQSHLSALAGQCPGCGETFKGARGLRAHQTRPFVAMACRPRKTGHIL